jgi:glycosyltransferase involved in cell wall biosynthesis
MRILQVFNRYLDRGGEQEWVERLPELVNGRHTIETLLFESRDWMDGNAPSKLKQTFLVGNNPSARALLAEKVRDFKPDILLFHNLIPVASLGLYEEAAELGVPVVQYLHNFRPFSTSGCLWVKGKINDAALRGNPWLEILGGAWNKSIVKTAILAWHLARLRRSGALESVKLWIAVSEFMRDAMIKAGLPADKVVTVRHCWPDSPTSILHAEGGHYLFLGHLSDEKGVPDLLEAWQMLELRMGDQCPELVIAGSGRLEGAVRKAAAKSNRITYAGHVQGEQKHQLLAKCRALIAPSAWWEPLGLIIYEAYEYSKPVIASLSGGLAETVQPGVTGLSHKPSDPSALCDAIEKMETSGPEVRARMGEAGHSWLKSNCSPSQWNETLESKVIARFDAKSAGSNASANESTTEPLKISIVTACYNQSSTIERTIKSIVGQEYPNLEYIVVDGASKDNTVDIVRKYESKISKIISEPDDGQYHAIQKGLDMATGEIMAWLNGDDMYFPWTFRLVNEIFTKYPDVDWIMGLPTFTDENDVLVKLSNQLAGYPQKWIANGWYSESFGGFLQQESMFWRKSLWDRSAKLDLSLSLAADFKLWTDLAKLTDLVSVSVPLGSFRDLPNVQRSVVMRDKYLEEVDRVNKKHEKPPWPWSAIGPRGLVARSLCRLFIIGLARCLVYGRRQGKWHLAKMRLPVSRSSLSDLRLEHHLSIAQSKSRL